MKDLILKLMNLDSKILTLEEEMLVILQKVQLVKVI